MERPVGHPITDQPPVTQPPDTLKQELAAEFELVRVVGEGSVARVYLAREVELRRPVAIKILRPELAVDATARARFEREARSAAKLAHPNVVEVHRVLSTSSGPCIVMEYIDGQNLADALSAGMVTDDIARQVLTEVASALAAAHAKGIVHRDVRPANVMWDAQRKRAVLTDFGIAGVLEEGGEAVTKLTRAGQVLGDPSYTSPEQLLGEPLTGATDVYSLAVMGYQLLAGEGPYAANGRAELASAHLRAEPRRLQDLRRDADPELSEILRPCLAKKPEQRPRAEDLAKRIEGAGKKPVPVSSGSARGFGTQGLDAAVERLPGLRGFIDELRRRRVFNVAVVYAVIAYAVLEGGSMVLPELPLPEWSYTVLVAITLAFLPVALVLGWMFDLGKEGITQTEATPGSITGAKLRILQATGLGLSLVVAGLIGWWILAS